MEDINIPQIINDIEELLKQSARFRAIQINNEKKSNKKSFITNKFFQKIRVATLFYASKIGLVLYMEWAVCQAS